MTVTAKLSLIVRVLASFSPCQTHPFAESLKVASETYKVDQYDEEEQVMLGDSKGLT